MSFHFAPVLAYVGPGAGFAFIGSFLSLLAGFLLGAASILLWPFRMAVRAITGKQGYRHAKVKKLIFLGLDGLDPSLAERYMAEGKLPNLSRLREPGRLPPPAHHLPGALAGGLVHLRHRRQPRAPRHVRLPQPRPEVLHAGARLRPRAPARARAQNRQVPHPAQPADRRDAPQEPHLLAHPRRTSHRLHHPPRPHHLPAGEVPRPPALGHVHARPAGHARHLRALHHPELRRVHGKRQPLSAGGARRSLARRNRRPA